MYAVLEDFKTLCFTPEKRSHWQAEEIEEADEHGLEGMEPVGDTPLTSKS